VDECTKFITHWSLRQKKIVGLNKKFVAMATSLERSQLNFTAIIYARRAINPEKLGENRCVNFAEIGLLD